MIKINTRKIFLALAVGISLAATALHATTWYMDPHGSDSNSGSSASPFATISKAQSAASSGDTVIINAGTYAVPNILVSTQRSVYAVVNLINKGGITYQAAAGTRPVFDFSAINPTGMRTAAFWVTATNVTFQGFDVIGVQENITSVNNQSVGFAIYGGWSNTWNQVNVHDGECVGFYIGGDVSGQNLFYRCDSYNNTGIDSNSYGNADGFGCHTGVGGVGNVFRECRAWNNSDDGYDTLNCAESVTFDHCWAYLNGNNGGNGNGFKVGGWGCSGGSMPAVIPVHNVQNCLAALNGSHGFYANHQPGQAANWYDNTGYSNKVANFDMLEGLDNASGCSTPGTREIMHNNLAYGGRATNDLNESGTIVGNNSWTLSVTLSDADFQSIDATQILQPRNADGSLPDITFMHLASGTDLIDAGINVGLPYNGTAPDLGCFESGATNATPSGVFIKTNNLDALNLPASWTNNAVPGSGGVAQWDATVSTPANATNSMGADMSWRGIKVVNPASSVQINAGKTLTLGSSGIDMSGATVNLTLSNDLSFADNVVQTWSIAAGKTLAVKGAFNQNNSNSAIYFSLTSGATVNIGAARLRALSSGGVTNLLHFTTYNGYDVGAVDASYNVVAAGSVIPGGYAPNPAAFTGNPTTNYVDMVNSNSGTNADINQTASLGVAGDAIVRFNQPQANRNYWLWSEAGQKIYATGTGLTILVTTNVGAQDVNFVGNSANALRFNGGSLILAQENPAGAFNFNSGTITASSAATMGNMLKYGVGKAVFNASIPSPVPVKVLEGELVLDGNAGADVLVGDGALFRCNGGVAGPLTVNAGAAVCPGNENAVGALSATNVTLAAGSTIQFYAPGALAANTTPLLKVAGSFTVGGTVNVSIMAGLVPVGQYPLIQWTGPIAPGDFANFNLDRLPLRHYGYLSNNAANSSIDLVITNVSEPINPEPPTLQFFVSGNIFSLAWPTNRGWILQSNSVGLTATNAWFEFPSTGSASLTNVNVLVDPANPNVFFRMIHP